MQREIVARAYFRTKYKHGCSIFEISSVLFLRLLRCYSSSRVIVRRWVFCNRKPGLRLENAWWEEYAELLVYLVDEERDIYIGVLVVVCHLGPAQLYLSAISV